MGHKGGGEGRGGRAAGGGTLGGTPWLGGSRKGNSTDDLTLRHSMHYTVIEKIGILLRLLQVFSPHEVLKNLDSGEANHELVIL